MASATTSRSHRCAGRHQIAALHECQCWHGGGHGRDHVAADPVPLEQFVDVVAQAAAARDAGVLGLGVAWHCNVKVRASEARSSSRSGESTVCDPARITVADPGRLTRVTADVRDPESMTRALADSTIVLSGLGVAHGEKPGVLSAGARAVADARPRRIIWIGAYGTGTSAAAAGALTRTLLRTFMRAELDDKVTADTTVLTAGGTVFHCGPLSDGPLSPARRTVTPENTPRRIFPARVSRATAAAMLDEAESGQHLGQTVVPLSR
jgi:uncharacterized protein